MSEEERQEDEVVGDVVGVKEKPFEEFTADEAGAISITKRWILLVVCVLFIAFAFAFDAGIPFESILWTLLAGSLWAGLLISSNLAPSPFQHRCLFYVAVFGCLGLMTILSEFDGYTALAARLGFFMLPAGLIILVFHQRLQRLAAKNRPTVHVFSGEFGSRDAALAYTEERWSLPPSDNSWPKEEPALTWPLSDDLAGVDFMDPAYVETITGEGRLGYLGTQLADANDTSQLRNSIPSDDDTLVLILSTALDDRRVKLSSTPKLRYHGEYPRNLEATPKTKP